MEDNDERAHRRGSEADINESIRGTSFPGFERLKLSRKDNNLMCFVEFQVYNSNDSRTAEAAIQPSWWRSAHT
jgi:hypothetical protein